MVTRTMKGREVDWDRLRTENKDMIAVGNASMNTSGDVVGQGGKVLKTADQLDAETALSREVNPAKSASIKENPIAPLVTPQHEVPELFETPAEAISRLNRERAEEMLQNNNDGRIIEDQGNDVFDSVAETISKVTESSDSNEAGTLKKGRKSSRTIVEDED